MSRCDIVIPVWNQLEITKGCVDSIKRNTRYPHRLIIIDNASADGTASYLNALKEEAPERILLIKNDENLGYVRAVNRGISASDAPYVCLMNNDTIAAKGWLEEMIGVIEAHPEAGLVNPSSNTSGQFPGAGQTVDDYAAGLARFKGQAQELYNCRGFCMLLKREVIEKLGLFDEAYTTGYFEETDYCKRAHGEGFGILRAKAAYVYHKEGASFKELKTGKDLFRANEDMFYKKWGRPVTIGYFVSSAASGDIANEIAAAAARNGYRVSVYFKKGMAWPAGIDHFDIRGFEIGPAFFELAAIYKIFKRKAKKPLDIILTDSKVLGNFLNVIKALHGSDVMINPDKKRLLEILDEKSKKR